jgi:hypothetical protein
MDCSENTKSHIKFTHLYYYLGLSHYRKNTLFGKPEGGDH